MLKTFISPGKYIQGSGVINEVGTTVEKYGSQALLISSESCRARLGRAVDRSFSSSSCLLNYGGFGGECSDGEISRLVKYVNDRSSDVILGVGGGKALDTAKAVGQLTKLPVICMPTLASTDAPCSAVSVIYTDEGLFSRYLFVDRNPDAVIIDTKIVSEAPSRFLVSGMGDALATYFEARSCRRSYAVNCSGGNSTEAAFMIAELCYKILLENGLSAKIACDRNVVTQSLEKIVEANTLLSGLGFESCGLAAAHSVHNGLTSLKQMHEYYHGEKVAFGTLVHLVLEDAPKSEIEAHLNFCSAVGLPVCFKDFNIENLDQDQLKCVSETACADGETIHNMPFQVSPDDVLNALLAADSIGEISKVKPSYKIK